MYALEMEGKRTSAGDLWVSGVFCALQISATKISVISFINVIDFLIVFRYNDPIREIQTDVHSARSGQFLSDFSNTKTTEDTAGTEECNLRHAWHFGRSGAGRHGSHKGMCPLLPDHGREKHDKDTEDKEWET